MPHTLIALVVTLLLVTAYADVKTLSKSKTYSKKPASAMSPVSAMPIAAAIKIALPQPSPSGATIIYAPTTDSPSPSAPPTTTNHCMSMTSAKDSGSFIQYSNNNQTDSQKIVLHFESQLRHPRRFLPNHLHKFAAPQHLEHSHPSSQSKSTRSNPNRTVSSPTPKKWTRTVRRSQNQRHEQHK